MSKGHTLFTHVCSWLLVAELNKTNGELPASAEASAYGELAGEPVNVNSFWALVVDVMDDDKHLVKDLSGAVFEIARADLRLRRTHCVAFAGSSDDLTHDRH